VSAAAIRFKKVSQETNSGTIEGFEAEVAEKLDDDDDDDE